MIWQNYNLKILLISKKMGFAMKTYMSLLITHECNLTFSRACNPLYYHKNYYELPCGNTSVFLLNKVELNTP